MAKTKTTTVTHYETQKERRHSTVEEWRKRQKTVVKGNSVKMHDTSRRIRRGVMVSADGDVPSLALDTNMYEVPPGAVSTIHRHSWDAIMFVVEGSGWTEINGQRHDWRAWDTLHLPSWAWHRHGTDAETPATFITFGSEPIAEVLNMALLEDGGDTPFDKLPTGPTQSPAQSGNDPYARRLQRLAGRADEVRDARLYSAFEELNFKVTPRGARSAFLVDQSIGYRTSGLTAVMHQLAPGLYQSRHRHGGEAVLYVAEGRGHSDIDEVSQEWEAGDIVVVDHWAWHQHFNDDPDNIASLIRVHQFDSLYMAMWVMLDPLNLFEELEKLDAPDLSSIEWPDFDAGRPAHSH